jgi:plastocyanin
MSAGAAGIRAAVMALAILAGAGSALAGKTVEVRIANMAFVPAEITVHVGDTVAWVNADSFDHTATAVNGDWDLAIPVGATARFTVTKAGTFDYVCRIHPNMTGKIHVTGP